MIVELVNTGSELILGRVLNTHQQWLCRRLADLGYVVSRQVAVPDSGPDILTAVTEGLGRADLLIVTGGLGPTSDDITRELIAQLLGRKLTEDAAVLAHLAKFFEQRKRLMPPRTRVQALVPGGAIVLHNEHGTAPGLAIKIEPNPFRSGAHKAWLILLPGPPRELRPMFANQVTPLITREFESQTFACRTLRATGIGESSVEEEIGPLLQPLLGKGLELGYCSRPGQVDVRLAGHGSEATRFVAEAESIVRTRIGRYLYAEEDDEIEDVIVRMLTERKQTLALAESCTGGCIANRITNVPGASAVLVAGLVTYSNAAKQALLGVPGELLEQHGAVSEPVARAMAEGALKATGATYAIGVTGIAGPSGGSAEKPVGTVFIGLSGSFKTVVVKNFNPVDRETFKQMTSQQALELLRRKVLDTPMQP